MKQVQLRPSHILSIILVISSLTIALSQKWLKQKGIDTIVLLSANLIIYIITRLTLAMVEKNVTNPNPHAFIRAVMGGTILKLMGIAGTVVVYLLIMGKHANTKTIMLSFVFYFIYTFAEVKMSLKLNSHHGGKQ
jgi:hypothetical protein